MEMLHKSSLVRCCGLLRMQRHVLIRLGDELEAKNYLTDSRYINVYEQVAMFLLTIGHNGRNFLIQYVFQHLSKTVSRQFHAILHALAGFANEMIKTLSYDETPLEILKNMKVLSMVQGLCQCSRRDTHSCCSFDRETRSL